MALKWNGNRSEQETTHFRIDLDPARHEIGADGRVTGRKVPMWLLWRRVLYNSGLWSKWALVSAFKTEAEAKAYAEDF